MRGDWLESSGACSLFSCVGWGEWGGSDLIPTKRGLTRLIVTAGRKCLPGSFLYLHNVGLVGLDTKVVLLLPVWQ
jgi:hypothetical protein